MVNVAKLKKLAKRRGMNLRLVSRRKQLDGKGVILDFDVSGGEVTRLKIASFRGKGQNANIWNSGKHGISFKSEMQLVKFMERFN